MSDMVTSIVAGKTALVTTNEWFTAPNGSSYKAVFGTIHGIFLAEKLLGLKSNAKSSNWYLQIGNLTLGGCQISFLIRTDSVNRLRGEDWSADAANGLKEYYAPSRIYMADEVF